MKTQFHVLGLNLNAGSRAWLEKQLTRLHNLVPVTTAKVVLERQRENAPAFRAHVHLAVPGPDIHTEARDHTLEAVWLKVTTALRKQIERRKARQQLWRKSNRQHPLTGSRWAGAPVGGRI
jgi:ribosome-associated translation inhibitor RaiA